MRAIYVRGTSRNALNENLKVSKKQHKASVSCRSHAYITGSMAFNASFASNGDISGSLILTKDDKRDGQRETDAETITTATERPAIQELPRRLHDSDGIRNEKKVCMFRRVASALFYALSSFTITIVNKNVLTVHGFPSVMCLGLGQILTTIFVLYLAKQFKLVDFPDIASNTWQKLRPLPLIYMGNMIFGLGGTKELSLPMFTALRRFLILITMIAEYYLLGSRPTFEIQLSVYVMIVGALTAAYDDLGFSVVGYAYIFLNNIFSAANGVVIKKKLESRDEMGTYGLMFYNSLFIFIPTLIIAHLSGELCQGLRYSGWDNPWFLLQFGLSCFMGFILTYSVFLCTYYNSALGTSIIGCFKNVCITYVGMVFGKDYIFSAVNFVGINISVAGSLIYLFCSQPSRKTGAVEQKM